MASKLLTVLQITILILNFDAITAQETSLGGLHEVFAWKQLTFNIDGKLLTEDASSIENVKEGGQVNHLLLSEDFDPRRIWGQSPVIYRTPTSTSRPSGGPEDFFIQYNNVPMGVERVEDRVFVSIPRRRYGIPSTLNVIDLNTNERSPPLTPYPNLELSRALTSVYRTRADECGRLWMVDTGLMELPGNPRQVQPPAIVIYDLKTNRQILRYTFKNSDIPAANTPTGLASITVDITGDCGDAFAYVPDLTTFGLIVYSLRQNDSWRITHNYFNFNPLAGNLRISGQNFQWSDGIFSITLSQPRIDGCRKAYFHALISTQEFSVSTCLLKNSTASADSNSWALYNYEGERGPNSQSTMHGYHGPSGVIFYADIGRDAVSCWNTAAPLAADTNPVIARDAQALSYPSDLHVTGDEVWVIANNLPKFGYATLDTNEYNFFAYRGNVKQLIAGTVCARA